MSTPKVIQIGLKLATHTHNYSVTEAICRACLFNSSCDVGRLLAKMKQSFPRFDEINSDYIDWLNIFLFNVCAFNQQLIADYDNQLLESTESASKTFSKNKQIIESNQVAIVKQQLKKWLQSILASPFFSSIFTQISVQSLFRDKPVRQLLETINYFLVKYQLACRFKPKITELIDKTQEGSNLSQMFSLFKNVNTTIFCTGERFSSLMDQIADNYQVNLQAIAKIVVLNYTELQPPRVAFQSAETTGWMFVEQSIDYIIRRIPKAELFSEKTQNYRPYQLLMNIIFQKEAAAFLEWNSIVQQLMDKGEKVELENSQNILKKFCSFFNLYIPNDYPCFHYILKYTYSSLLAKYSSVDSLELMKKFLLNRLFLNPSFFALLSHPNELQIKEYVNSANSLRTLFYQKKTAALAEQQKRPKLLQLSQLLINSMKSMLSAKQTNKKGLNVRDRGIYVNDKLLIKIYGQVNDGFNGYKIQSHRKANQSQQSDYSLSFSLKNQSKSKAGLQSPPPIHTNSELPPPIPKHINKISLTNKGQALSILNQKGESSLQSSLMDNKARESAPLGEMDKLDELIHLRRDYGQLHRDISARCKERKARREKRERELWTFHEISAQIQKQLLGHGNELLINSFIF